MAFRGADCVKFLNLRNGLALCGERLFKPPQVRVKACGILRVGCDGCDCSAGKEAPAQQKKHRETAASTMRKRLRLLKKYF